MTPHKIVAAITVAAFACAAPSAMAQSENTVDLEKGGSTKLSLGTKAKNVLREAGTTVSGKTLGITGGTIDPVDGNPADITHQGKLTFRAGGDKVVFKGVEVGIGAKGKLIGRTGGNTVTIANLTGGSVARQGIFSTDVNGLNATLSRAAANALNATLETHKFRRGLKLGTVSIDARLAEVLIAAAGSTTLELSAEALQKLGQAGVAPSVVAPATLADADADSLPEASFPITGGKLDPDTLFGNVSHAGGLLLTKASNGRQLPLSEPGVLIDATPALDVSLGGARAEAADLDLSSMTKAGTPNGVDLAGVVVKLNAAAAALLNATFETTVFAAGDVVGTAWSTMTFK